MLKLLLTCEHGGNNIPIAFQPNFVDHKKTLNSHLGYDIGALELFHELEDIADVSFYSETSRLLVELNRSLHHNKLFSDFTRSLADKDKNEILKHYYYPYRDKVEQMVQDLVMAGRRVLHISIHSFTPILDGEVRKADIGLLYDPKRKGEQIISREWRDKIINQDPNLVVRYNYPYLGIADGFPTYLRKLFKENDYLGIELEVNQKFPEGDKITWEALKSTIKQTLIEIKHLHCKDHNQHGQIA
jgi:predicted N-formylglutamate amidohydrolase